MASLTIDWLHLLVLLGALQGILLAGALATKRRNRTANRLLAALMVALSLHLASSVYHAGGFIARFPHFFGVGYPLPFLYGPLVYLYAQCAADRDRRLTARDALHLLPFLTVVVLGAPIYLQGAAEKVASLREFEAGHLPLLIRVADPLKLVSGVAYAVATLRFLQRHRERVKESYSSIERVNLRWLLWIGAAAAAIWGIAMTFELLRLSGAGGATRSDDWVSLAIAILVFGTGYLGLRQPEVFRFETGEHRMPLPPVAPPAPPAVAGPDTSPPAGPESPRYERSGLSGREAERLKERLRLLMEQERPWRDSGLTLAVLAARLATTPHKLSEVLNLQLGESFYDFVNGYRVREVQRRIAAGDAERLKMLALALEAGFASKSTFNQAFKKHTSRTPSEFLRYSGV